MDRGVRQRVLTPVSTNGTTVSLIFPAEILARSPG